MRLTSWEFPIPRQVTFVYKFYCNWVCAGVCVCVCVYVCALWRACVRVCVGACDFLPIRAHSPLKSRRNFSKPGLSERLRRDVPRICREIQRS